MTISMLYKQVHIMDYSLDTDLVQNNDYVTDGSSFLNQMVVNPKKSENSHGGTFHFMFDQF